VQEVGPPQLQSTASRGPAASLAPGREFGPPSRNAAPSGQPKPACLCDYPFLDFRPTVTLTTFWEGAGKVGYPVWIEGEPV
jgi:hypothetical protein